MKNSLTDITVIMDRSGSMEVCKTDAEGGINAFIEEQKKLPGEANLTMVQFDNVYEVLYSAKPIKQVLAYALQPRGNTALLDAVGKTIVTVGERLAAMSEHDRPGLVTMVIVTDGQENASTEYNKARVAEMVQHQREVYKWQFIFLSADMTSFADAANMGFSTSTSAKYNAVKTAGAINLASKKLGAMRGEAFNTPSEAVIDYDGLNSRSEFTDAERAELDSSKK